MEMPTDALSPYRGNFTLHGNQHWRLSCIIALPQPESSYLYFEKFQTKSMSTMGINLDRCAPYKSAFYKHRLHGDETDLKVCFTQDQRLKSRRKQVSQL